ncbi:hypothetical protein [Teredinibacter sp. KSP-S5-2]|uniref:hypothetical protein n=1 Tax=Teredinibacter sp. KSP-S5-2 TaxID=3034506 RepID=UPI002934A9F1|nr:hypothetical protein [Teredinibacter sp. KSP-S5-2]WNO08249.1 hypothetical protein P5V12_14860 [Teredinibacter sp. KSP-S5-2]
MAEEDHLRRLIKYIEVDSKGSSFKCDVGNDPEHIMREQEDYNVSHGDFLNDVEPISKMEFDIIWVNVNYAS